MKTRLIFLVLVWLLVACQSAPPSPTPIPTETQPPTATSEPEPFFLPAQTPSIFSRNQQPWFAGVVEPGAILYHNGQFHLFFNGFTGWPSKVAVGYAVSQDGQTWTLPSDPPILDSATETFDGYTFFASSALVEEDKWTLFLYTLAEGRDGAPGMILRATAPDPAGKWTLDPEPVLTAGGGGTWDTVRVTDPSVVRTPDGYLMWYTGADTDRLSATRMIGLATSPDGIHWTKHPEPVLALGKKGAWDGYRVFQPHVVQTPDGYLMLYKANVQIGQAEAFGFAYSHDGVNWERHEGNPVIEEKTYGLEWLRKGYADLLYHEGVLYLYLEVLEREGGAWAHGNSDYFSNTFLLKHEIRRERK
jgi:predicted GH43/DUF377 family glycosyl hydrolase